MKIIYNHLIFCAAAILCDVVTTYVAIEHFGGIELNPIIYPIIPMGWDWFVLVKFGLGAGLPAIYCALRKSELLLLSGWLHMIIASINIVQITIVRISQ